MTERPAHKPGDPVWKCTLCGLENPISWNCVSCQACGRTRLESEGLPVPSSFQQRPPPAPGVPESEDNGSFTQTLSSSLLTNAVGGGNADAARGLFGHSYGRMNREMGQRMASCFAKHGVVTKEQFYNVGDDVIGIAVDEAMEITRQVLSMEIKQLMENKMLDAVIAGDASAVIQSLEAKVDPNFTNKQRHFNSPLMMAAVRGK